ncbi:MAG: RNA polymerase factor sigma-54 [Bacteroidales bacterium]|jgi:RNA polymerase sigma-54 factor|nr:RNA polymerase factor sigma-54 [Bacteroidales bacterium]MBQ9654135.1 RNA polymerase factor sigma-54 [Bacteroidales bacterium]
MAAIEQGLQQKLQQKLSPLQIQTIKLIEMPVQALEQHVREVLNDNPVLDDTTPQGGSDEPRDVSISEVEEREQSGGSLEENYGSNDDDIPSYNLHVNNWGKDERPEYNTFSVKQSFSQSLLEQLGYRNLTDHQRTVATFIIGSLDDDGYLRRDIESLVDDLAFRAGVEATAEEVEDMLKVIQQFEPSGVGARDLRECLLIQLEDKKRTPSVENAIKVVDTQFEAFKNRHFQKIMARLHLSEDEMKAVMEEIRHLNPAPGGDIDDSYNDQAQQVVPDFRLEYEHGELILSMPRFSIPELRINHKYSEILETGRMSNSRADKDAAAFVKQKIDSAKWFVEALRQRQNTLESTMRAILDYQREYFMDGDESSLKPMVLKDIAERTGFDISTISRVVNSKWIETHFGIFPLKYFFSEGLENSDGEEVSTREIKKVLKDLVDSEDKHNPLTDDELVDALSSKGYKVARRTIAKYRAQLDIPKARMRRDL